MIEWEKGIVLTDVEILVFCAMISPEESGKCRTERIFQNAVDISP